MATLKTTDVSHVREDLEDIISNISPEDTPFLTSIAKVSASQKTHEWTQDKLRARNKNNAAIEGAEAAAAAIALRFVSATTHRFSLKLFRFPAV